MDNKIIGVMLCVCIFIFGSIQTISATPIDNLDLDPEMNEKIENLIDAANITLGDIFFITDGPASKLYSKVELLEGSENQINRINRYLNRKLLRPLIFLRQIPIFVENLSFTLEFKRDVRTRSRYQYFCWNASVKWNKTTGEFEGFNLKSSSHIFNKAHKVNVENLTGFFLFQRSRLYNGNQPIFWKFFWPARITFIGFCKNITYS